MWKYISIAWNLRKVKKAFSEINDVLIALRATNNVYQAAKEDGEVTPAEMRRIAEQTGILVEQTAEAVDILRKIF